MSTLKDLLRRLRMSMGWVAAQFWATLLIVLVGVAWTRVPERHVWQVGLTLLLPLLMLAAVLVLEAGTMRRFFDQEDAPRAVCVGRAHAAGLDRGGVACMVDSGLVRRSDSAVGGISELARLGERAGKSLHLRAHFNLAHVLEWIFRWIVVPAKVIPHAMASAQWGWRLPWRKLLRMMLNWRWWIGAVIAALVGVLLPSYFFNGEPHGTVAHQVWAAILKPVGAYLLAMASWVLLLAWAAVLLARDEHKPKTPGDDALVAAPVGSAPLGKSSIKLPLPESDEGASGNI